MTMLAPILNEEENSRIEILHTSILRAFNEVELFVTTAIKGSGKTSESSAMQASGWIDQYVMEPLPDLGLTPAEASAEVANIIYKKHTGKDFLTVVPPVVQIAPVVQPITFENGIYCSVRGGVETLVGSVDMAPSTKGVRKATATWHEGVPREQGVSAINSELHRALFISALATFDLDQKLKKGVDMEGKGGVILNFDMRFDAKAEHFMAARHALQLAEDFRNQENEDARNIVAADSPVASAPLDAPNPSYRAVDPARRIGSAQRGEGGSGTDELVQLPVERHRTAGR
jgi:hypothetical protein